jgi:hypothetical protein
MALSYEEKLALMKHLNWDYLDKHEDMLAVIEGKLESSGCLTRDKLFVRSMERLSWYSFIDLWGIETIKMMYTPELARRIWPPSRRKHYDFAIGLLRGETLSATGWDFGYFKSPRHRFFSDRGDST